MQERTWWHGPGAYELHGPHATREEAVAEARMMGHRYLCEAAENDDDWFEDMRGEWINEEEGNGS